jgi:hypothetical protein
MRKKLHALWTTAVVLVLTGPLTAGPAAATDYHFSYGKSVSGDEYGFSQLWMDNRSRITAGKYGWVDGDAERWQGQMWFLPDPELGGSSGPEPELIWIQDVAADGKRVGVHWKTTDGNDAGMCVHKEGIDEQWSGHHMGITCLVYIPEGKRFKFRIGVCDADVNPCGAPDTWTTKLDNWNWGTKGKYVTNGWVDYYDDADTTFDWADECDEIHTNTDC